eukprot:487697_1
MGNAFSPIENLISHWDENEWQLLVDGYIQRHQKNIDYRIPKSLNKLIYNYSYQIAMKLDKELVIEGWTDEPMLFVDDVTIEHANSRIATTCLLCSTPITSDICDEFMVEVKWISTPTSLFMKIGQWFLGYMNISENVHKLKDKNPYILHQTHNRILGGPNTVLDTVTVFISHGDRAFKLHDGSTTTKYGAYLSYQATNNFANGDTFAMKFNFVLSTITLYHNGSRAAIIPLKHKHIVPCLTMYSC